MSASVTEQHNPSLSHTQQLPTHGCRHLNLSIDYNWTRWMAFFFSSSFYTNDAHSRTVSNSLQHILILPCCSLGLKNLIRNTAFNCNIYIVFIITFTFQYLPVSSVFLYTNSGLKNFYLDALEMDSTNPQKGMAMRKSYTVNTAVSIYS